MGDCCYTCSVPALGMDGNYAARSPPVPTFVGVCGRIRYYGATMGDPDATGAVGGDKVVVGGGGSGGS